MQTNTSQQDQQVVPSLDGVRAKTLAHVNFGLFRELISRGTSPERVCTTLCLNSSEYEYLAQLR
jgi:hypothetical protein